MINDSSVDPFTNLIYYTATYLQARIMGYYSTTLLIILIGTALLQRMRRIRLFQLWRERIVVFGSIFAIGVLWDSFAVAKGIWSYRSSLTLGLKIGYLPVEDYFFIIIVPYFVMVVYRALRKQ